MWPFKPKEQKTETRASGLGYTAQMMQARNAYISGQDGLAELTATVQGCVTHWERGLSLSDVTGTDMLTPRHLALVGRSLALRGEAVFAIRDDALLPCSDWDLTTRGSVPTAYRVGIADTGGGKSETLLASEVLHLRIGADMGLPYIGQSPLRSAPLTAGLLHAVETALADVYNDAPLGSSVIPFPEAPETDMADVARGFRGFRGKVMVRESVNVTAAGGPAPQTDLNPSSVSPDISKAMTKESMAAAKSGIEMLYGVLPALSNPATTGPMVREAQRHLAQWALQPVAAMIGQEATDKLGDKVELDVMRPLQAFDAGGRARSFAAIVQTFALAKQSGVDPAQALQLVDWGEPAD